MAVWYHRWRVGALHVVPMGIIRRLCVSTYWCVWWHTQKYQNYRGNVTSQIEWCEDTNEKDCHSVISQIGWCDDTHLDEKITNWIFVKWIKKLEMTNVWFVKWLIKTKNYQAGWLAASDYAAVMAGPPHHFPSFAQTHKRRLLCPLCFIVPYCQTGVCVFVRTTENRVAG